MSELNAATLFDLTGKVAVVTGGAGDIGVVYGRVLVEAGASVALADLKVEAADAAAATLEAEGYHAMGVELNVTSPESAAAMVAAVTERFGGIDILVNNAAIMVDLPPGRMVDLAPGDFNRVMNVNTTGAVVCSKAVVDSMTARGGGRIINGSSAGAFIPGGIYGVSKFALHSVTATLATELGPLGINVNSIAPGLIESESGYASLPKDSPVRGHLAAMIPGQTSGPPEDLAGTLLLLCSQAGKWINGQTISVDGGWVIRL